MERFRGDSAMTSPLWQRLPTLSDAEKAEAMRRLLGVDGCREGIRGGEGRDSGRCRTRGCEAGDVGARDVAEGGEANPEDS